MKLGYGDDLTLWVALLHCSDRMWTFAHRCGRNGVAISRREDGYVGRGYVGGGYVGEEGTRMSWMGPLMTFGAGRIGSVNWEDVTVWRIAMIPSFYALHACELFHRLS